MCELRKGASYQAAYGEKLLLRIVQEDDLLRVVVHDTTKGALEGKVFNGTSPSVAEGKELAISKADSYLNNTMRFTDVEWRFSDVPPTPVWS
jgi:hypothetical protein